MHTVDDKMQICAAEKRLNVSVIPVSKHISEPASHCGLCILIPTIFRSGSCLVINKIACEAGCGVILKT